MDIAKMYEDIIKKAKELADKKLETFRPDRNSIVSKEEQKREKFNYWFKFYKKDMFKLAKCFGTEVKKPSKRSR